jgi:hypothetical protein
MMAIIAGTGGDMVKPWRDDLVGIDHLKKEAERY